MTSCCDLVLAADQPPDELLGLVSDLLETGLLDAKAPYPSLGRITGFLDVDPREPYPLAVDGVDKAEGLETEKNEDVGSNLPFSASCNILGMDDDRLLNGVIEAPLLGRDGTIGEELSVFSPPSLFSCRAA